MADNSWTLAAVAALAATLLLACGGGSDSSEEQQLSISGTPPTTAQVGRPWSFEPVIYDPEGEVLTVTVLNKPDWITLLPSKGLMYGIPGEGDVRTWEKIRVQVTNGKSSASLPEFRINVVAEGASEDGVLLSWLPPTERVDGSPIGELSAYRILYGQVSGNYDQIIAIDNPGITSYLVEDLGPGTWYFALISVTSDGLSSVPSNEVNTRI
jgi:hypothetical protein